MLLTGNFGGVLYHLVNSFNYLLHVFASQGGIATFPVPAGDQTLAN